MRKKNKFFKYIISIIFHFYHQLKLGTSIGFKNIASKIAYDLRL